MPRFTHLHVASELSAGYATGSPEELVTAAVHDGADVAAITDRDGLYGAIRHIRACRSAGIDAVVGVDLALLPVSAAVPAFADARITVLAHGHNDGAGWAALCRLISAAHSPGAWAEHSLAQLGIPRSGPVDFLIDDGTPVATVLLGPDSDVGRAVAAAQADVAAALLAEWKRLLPGAVVVEVVCHFAEPADSASLRHATRMLQLADAAGVPAVLSNATRYVWPGEGLDADGGDDAGSLRPLGAFRQQPNGHAWLKPAELMVKLAHTIAHHSSLPRGAAQRLLSETERLADLCRLHPETDLRWGKLKNPEASVLGVTGDPLHELRSRSEGALLDRYAHTKPSELEALRARLDRELDSIGDGGVASYFLTVAEVSQLMRDLDVRNQPHGASVDSLVNYLLRISEVDPARHGLLDESRATQPRSTLPDIDIDVQSDRRHEVYRAIFDRFGTERTSLLSMHNESAHHGNRELGVAHDPGGVILGDDRLLSTTPMQPGHAGLPTSQFDRDDMRAAGLLTLGLHGAPIQSSLAFTVAEIRRVHGARATAVGGLPADAPYVKEDGSILLDDIPFDDQQTFEAIRTTRTIGIFQIESRDQQQLIKKTPPVAFNDLVDDISLLHLDAVPGEAWAPSLERRHNKAYAVALALSTFHSAWLKTHYPAEFLAAILTHGSSVHPGRLLLEEARRMRIPVLPLDVNTSSDVYRVERIDPPRPHGVLPDPDEVIVGIRLSLAEVHGITTDELDRILIGQPYASVADFYQRATPSRGLLTSLGLVGALDSLVLPAQHAADPSRSEVMARVRELLALRRRPRASTAATAQPTLSIFVHDQAERPDDAAEPITEQSATAPLDIPKAASASEHVIESYRPLLDELGVVPVSELPSLVSGSEVLIAGIRVPSRARSIRGGKREVCISLDDGSGCTDATFFEKAQAQMGPLLSGTKLLVIQGTVRRTGSDDDADVDDDGISLDAVNAWDLKALWAQWQQTGGAERQAS